MRLTQVKDILQIERDGAVRKNSAEFLVVLLSRVVSELGAQKMITRKTIEQLSPVDFVFLVDFLNEINHQVIKRAPCTCAVCGEAFLGELGSLGGA
jgi:hypothetical protein